MIIDALSRPPRTRLRHALAAFTLIPRPAFRGLASDDPAVRRDAQIRASHAALKHAIAACTTWLHLSSSAAHHDRMGWLTQPERAVAALHRTLLRNQLLAATDALGSGAAVGWHDPACVVEALRVLRPTVGLAAALDFERWRPVELLTVWALGRAAEAEDASIQQEEAA